MRIKTRWIWGLLLSLLLIAIWVSYTRNKYSTVCDASFYWNDATAVLQIRCSEMHWKGSLIDGLWALLEWQRKGTNSSATIQAERYAVFYVVQDCRVIRIVSDEPWAQSWPIARPEGLFFYRKNDVSTGRALSEGRFRAITSEEVQTLTESQVGFSESLAANNWKHDSDFSPGGFRGSKATRNVELDGEGYEFQILKDIDNNGLRTGVHFGASGCERQLFTEDIDEVWSDRPRMR